MALTDNLLAFYKLDNTNDSSGNNRTLTNNGNVSFASGKIGNAAVFDGSGQFSIPSLDYQTGSDISVSGWFKKNSTDNSGTGILTCYYYGGGANGPFTLWDEGSALHYMFVNSEGNVLDNVVTTSLEADVWYNMLFTYNQSTSELKGYLNGSVVLNEQVSGLMSKNAATFEIGSGENGNFMFNGSIDAVGIWNRALSEQEVAALYNNGTGLELDGGNGGGGGGNPTLVKMEAPIKFFGKVKFGV